MNRSAGGLSEARIDREYGMHTRLRNPNQLAVGRADLGVCVEKMAANGFNQKEKRK